MQQANFELDQTLHVATYKLLISTKEGNPIPPQILPGFKPPSTKGPKEGNQIPLSPSILSLLVPRIAPILAVNDSGGGDSWLSRFGGSAAEGSLGGGRLQRLRRDGGAQEAAAGAGLRGQPLSLSAAQKAGSVERWEGYTMRSQMKEAGCRHQHS